MTSQQVPPQKPSATADYTRRRPPPLLSAAVSSQAASGTPMSQLAIDVPVVPGIPFEILLRDYLINAQDTISITSDPVVSWVLLDTAEPPKISGTVPVDFLGSLFNLTATFTGPELTYSILFSLDIFRTVAFLTIYRSDAFTIDLVPLLWKTSDHVQSIDLKPNVDWLTLDVAQRTISAHVPSSAGQTVNITLHAITELPDMNTPGEMGELLSRDTDDAYMLWLNLNILDRPTSSSTTTLPTSSSQAAPTMNAVTESGLDSSATASPSRTYVSTSSGPSSLKTLSSPVAQTDNASLSFSVARLGMTTPGSVVSLPVITSTWSTGPASSFTESSQEQSDEAESVITTSTSTGIQSPVTVVSAKASSTTPASTNVLISPLGTMGVSNSEVVPTSASIDNSAGPSTIPLDVATTQSLIIPTKSPSSVSRLSHTGDTSSEVTSTYTGSKRVSTAPSSEMRSSRFVHAQFFPFGQNRSTVANISSTSVSSSQSGVSANIQSEISWTASTSPEDTTMTSLLETGSPGLVSSGSVSFAADSITSASPLDTSGSFSGRTSTEAAVSNQLPGEATLSIFSTPSTDSVASSVPQTLPDEISSLISNSMLQTTRHTTNHGHSGSSNLIAMRSPSTSSAILVASTSIPASTVSQTPVPTSFVFARDQTLTIDLAPYLANPNDTLLSANTTADWLQLDLDRKFSTLSVSSNQASGNAAVIVRVRGVAGNLYTFSLQLTMIGQMSSVMSSSEPAVLSSTASIDVSTGDYTSLTLTTSTVRDMSIPSSTSPQFTQISDGSTALSQLTSQIQTSSLEPPYSPLTSDLPSTSSLSAGSPSSESGILPSSSGPSSTQAQTPTPTSPVFEVNQGQSIKINMNPYLRSPTDTLMEGSPDWVTSDPDDGTVLVAVPADQTPGNITISVMVESSSVSNTYALYVHLIIFQSRTSSSMTWSQTMSSIWVSSDLISVSFSTGSESVILQSASAAISSSLSTSTIASSMSKALSPSSYESMTEALSHTESQTSEYTGTSSSLGLLITSFLASTLAGPRNSATSTPFLSPDGQLVGPQTSSVQQTTNNSMPISTSELTSTLIRPDGTYTSMMTSQATSSNSSFAVSELSSGFISTSQSQSEWNSSTSLTTNFAGYTKRMTSSSHWGSLVGSSDSFEISSTSLSVLQNTTSIQNKSTSTMSPLLSSISSSEISSNVSSTIQASSLAPGASTSGVTALSSTTQYAGGLSSSVQDTTGRISTSQASDTRTRSTDQLASSSAQTSQRSTSQTSLIISSTQSSTVPSLSQIQNKTSSQFSESSSNAQVLKSETTQFSATTTVQSTSATQSASASVQGSQFNASVASSLIPTSPSVGLSSGSSTPMLSVQTTSPSAPPPQYSTPTSATSTGSTISQQSLPISSTQTQQSSSVLSTSPVVVTSTSHPAISSLTTFSSTQSSTLLLSTSSETSSSSGENLSSSQTTQTQSSSSSFISSMVGNGTSPLASSIMTATQALSSVTLTSSSSLPSATFQISRGISSSIETASTVTRAPTTSSEFGSFTSHSSASVAQITSSVSLSSTSPYPNPVSSGESLSYNGQSSSSTSKITSSSLAVGSSSQVLSSTSQFPTSLSITASSSSQSVSSSTQAASSSGQLPASLSTAPPFTSQSDKSITQTVSSSSQRQTSLSITISSSSQGITSILSSPTSSQASSSRAAPVANSPNLQSSTSSAVSQAFSTLTLSSVSSQSIRIPTSSQQSTTTSVDQSSVSSPSTLTSTSTSGNSLQARNQTSSPNSSINVSTTSVMPKSSSPPTISATITPSSVINQKSSTTKTTSFVTTTTSLPPNTTPVTAIAISATTNVTSQLTQQATTVTTAAAASSSSSSILCYDDFNSGTFGNWTTYSGTWSAAGKSFQETDYVLGAKALFTPGCQPYSNFTYDGYTTINNVSSSAGTLDGDAGFIFRVTNASNGTNAYNGYYAYINRNNFTGLGVVSQGWKGLTTTSMPIAVGTTYHMRVTAIGANIRVYVTDMVTPKITWSDSTWSSGLVGVRIMYTVAGWDNMTLESPIA